MSDNNPYGPPPQDPYGPGGQPDGTPAQGAPQPGGPPPGWTLGQPGYPGAGQPPPPPGGYAFGPFSPGQPPPQFAGQPGQPIPGGPGQPGQPYGLPPAGVPAPKRRNKLPLIIGAAALALVLLVVGIVAAVRSGNDEPAVVTDPSTGTSSTPSAAPAALASDAVTGFLTALAAGDVTTAVSFANEPVTDDSLIDTAVVADSLKRAPITDISVPVVTDEYAYKVTASYKLGGKPVSDSYRVEKIGDVWKLNDIAAEMDLSTFTDDGVPIVINGKRVTSDEVYALPGSYVFTTTLSSIGFGSKNTVTVNSPETFVATYNLKPALTSAGKKAILDATSKNFNDCLKKKAIDPSGCPFALNEAGYKIDASTIKWTRIGTDPLKNPRITVDGTLATLQLTYKVKGTASCNGGNRCSGTASGTNYANFDLTAKTLKLDWEY